MAESGKGITLGKLIWWAIGAGVLFYIGTQPTEAAATAKTLISAADYAYEALKTFFNSL